MVRGMVCHLLEITARGFTEEDGGFSVTHGGDVLLQEMYMYALDCKPSLAAGSLADND